MTGVAAVPFLRGTPTVPDRPDRRREARVGAADPARQARRSPPQRRCPRVRQRHPLSPPLWWGLAAFAARHAPVGTDLGLLPALTGGRHLGDHRHPPRVGRSALCGGATGSRARPCATTRRSRRREGGPCGYDAGKKTNRRKRHYLVETDGLLLRAKIQAADIQDYDGTKVVLMGTRARFPRQCKVWMDRNYRGSSWRSSPRRRARMASGTCRGGG
jgi:hypothetical protein